MTSKEFRGTYAWKTARRMALRGATHCAICGGPLRFDVGRRHRLYPTVDHVWPLARLDLSTAAGRAVAVDPSLLRVAHMGCNASRGNRATVTPAPAAAPAREAIRGEEWMTPAGRHVAYPWNPIKVTDEFRERMAREGWVRWWSQHWADPPDDTYCPCDECSERPGPNQRRAA